MSDRPDRRVKDLQTGNPHEIKLLLAIQCNDAYRLENDFHKYFDNEKTYGEWFKINDSIKNFVKNLKIREYKDVGGIG